MHSLRLIAHEKPVLGVNYPRRTQVTLPTATVKAADGFYEAVFTAKEKAQAGKLEQVATLGLGLCLMRMNAIGGLEWPLFEQTMEGSQLRFGEDVYLFRKLEAAGVPVFLDHGLSWEVGHIAARILMNSHTVRTP